MKLNKIFTAFMAVAMLALGFSSCKPKEGADEVKLMFNTCEVSVGESFTVKVVKQSGDIVWTSADEKIATVAEGVITGVAEGKTVVTATVGSAKANVEVTVKAGGAATTPEIAKPADGFVTIVLNIPAGSECHGVAFKGTVDGAAWSGADTYLNADGTGSSADNYAKFEAIAGYPNWYKATYKLGTTPWGDNADILMAGKICLVYSGDGSWQGQASKWEVNEEYTGAAWSKSDDGNLQVNGSGVVYVDVEEWQMSECADNIDYEISVTVPAGAPAAGVEIIGSFDDWAGTPMTKVDDTHYTAKISAQASAEFKFREAGTWDNEIEWYNAEEDAWKGLDNMKFADKADAQNKINLDYSDATKFRWKVTL